MNCDTFKQNINNYLDGELNDKKSRDLEAHLKTCRECMNELKSFDKCIQVIRKVMPDKTPPDSIRKGIFDKLKI